MATRKTETETRTKTLMVLTYDDGREEKVNLSRPMAAISFEREYGRSVREDSMEDVLRLTYIVLGHPNGANDEDFDAWASTIDDMGPETVEVPKA